MSALLNQDMTRLNLRDARRAVASPHRETSSNSAMPYKIGKLIVNVLVHQPDKLSLYRSGALVSIFSGR